MTRSWVCAPVSGPQRHLVAAESVLPQRAAPTLRSGRSPGSSAATRRLVWDGVDLECPLARQRAYALQHNQGRSNVALEQRSVRFPQKVGTPWKQVAVVAPGSAPAVGQWIRARIQRHPVPSVPTGTRREAVHGLQQHHRRVGRRLAVHCAPPAGHSSGSSAKARLAPRYQSIDFLGRRQRPHSVPGFPGWLASPARTASRRCLSRALMTSSALSPRCGASHGPPSWRQVAVFMSSPLDRLAWGRCDGAPLLYDDCGAQV